ncbi:MAG: EAL domain-containing protein [Gammaproteobacteria bacterium]
MRAYLASAALPLKHRLLWYRITGILGEGGFGITYAAEDTNLHHRVAIKEYFPRGDCLRDTLLDVVVQEGRDPGHYEWGLRRFLDEARTLARFRHPNIVQVRTAFEHYRTAYMVMDLEHGQTLEQAFKLRQRFSEAEILALAGPLLHGLNSIHAAGFIHRDIKLENIILRADGTPVLVDFGSARHLPGRADRGLTALVTRGFAPFEQYAQDAGGAPQGAWCDIYSLAAVLYVLVTARLPPDALTRAAALGNGAPDPLAAASELARDVASPALLAAIDHGLAFEVDARPASVDDWLALFPAELRCEPSSGTHTDPHAGAATPRLHSLGPSTEYSERPTDFAAPTTGGVEPDAELPSLPATLRVLVVDDEPYFRALLLRVLARLGVQGALAANGGTSALQLLDSCAAIDVVVLDLRMPEMDGIEFLRALRDSVHRPAIVLLSGVDATLLRAAEDFARSNHLEVLGATRKPVTPRDLGRLLVRHAQRSAPAAPPMPRLLHEAELLEGLANGALVPVYQPKITLADNSIAGVETLARWQLADGSLLGPAAFIPLAERSGHIHALTLALMESALADCGAWSAGGLNIDLALNVSAASFADLRFPDTLEQHATLQGVAPQRLVLEITERTVADDFLAMMNILVRLRLKGITLSIDDFGTGYSSLQQLHKLPFSELKIDRAFVAGAVNDPRALSILEASVELAHKLDMTTIAEGVETSAELEVVRRLGCDCVQGYYFARPMRGHELIAWAERHLRGEA